MATGTFDVEVRELTGNTVLQHFTDGMAALPAAPGAQSGLDNHRFHHAGWHVPGNAHRPRLPGATLEHQPASQPGKCGWRHRQDSRPCTTACTQSFTVSTPGNYDLFVVATAADPDKAGLYSLKIVGGPAGAVVYQATQPTGLLPAATSITLPTAASYTLSSTDFAAPAVLSALKLRLVQGADVLASLDSAGSSIASTTALAGAAQLYASARASNGMGVYGVGLVQGAQAIYADVRTLPSGFDTTLNTGGYRYPFTVVAAASHRLQVRDLNFPSPFTQARAVVVQNGAVVQSVSGTPSTRAFRWRRDLHFSR